MTKIIYSFLAVLILIGSIWTYKLIWGKPFTFNHFVERIFIKAAICNPELLTNLGSIENTIWDFHSSKLTDISAKRNLEDFKKTKNDLKTLLSYDRQNLSEQEQITYDLLLLDLNNTMDCNSFNYGTILSCEPYPVNQLFGMQSYLPDFMINLHQIINKKSAKNYISRLSLFQIKFKELIEELKLREKNKVTPPLFVIEKTLNQMKQFIEPTPSENILFTSFKEKMKKTSISEKDQMKLQTQAIDVIKNKVYPAYEELIKFLENQKTIATTDDGVWKLPNGDAFYAYCLKVETTTNYSPEKIHNIGLEEVARIHAEMRQILDSEGYKEKSISEAMNDLNHDPKFLYPSTDEGKQRLIADFALIYDEAQDKLGNIFLTLPKAKLKVEKVPDFMAKTAPAAYYQPASWSDARPGIFYVNTHDVEIQPKFAMHALAYHEGIPGHHLQIAIAQELTNLPKIRRLAGYNAYVEGWALYCEKMAFEYLFNSDPYSNLGRLQMELMRAVRLVVDTGIHYKRWTREEAIQYMVDNTGMSKTDVIIEIERYIVLPGQACSYKLGMIKILELREKMKVALGDNFDIRKFHDLVLRNGALPLDLLEKYVLKEMSK
ncbi:MAG: DUF885 domain-containing protein [Chlamydiae bacterium]|nr:DUF885 domain-containing protein [Chlamydiota bacterium]